MAIVRRIRAAAAWAIAILVVPACNALSGVGDYEFPYAECFPGELVSCYSGPPQTENIGLCRGGQRRCSDDGAQLGPCEGEVTPAPIDNCTTLQDDDCDGSIGPQCSGTPVWLKVFGAENGNDEGLDVAADPSGRVIFCGSYEVGFDLAPGIALENQTEAATSFVAGLTPAGAGVWGVGEDGGPDGEQFFRLARGVAVGPNDGAAYVVGDNMTSLYAKKVSSAGAVLWDMSFGLVTDAAVAPHASGLVLIGSSTEATDFGGENLPPEGGADVVVASLTGAGDHVWSRRFGPTGDQQAGGIAVDGGSNVLIAGCFQAAIALGCGEMLADPSNNGAYFLAKLSPAGECLWNVAFPSAGGGGQDGGCSARVAADASGSVVFTGSVQGAVDFGGGALDGDGRGVAVAKFTPAGAHVWSKRFGVAQTQTLTIEDVAVDPTGNALLTGSFVGQLNFGDTEDTQMEKTIGPVAMTDGFVVKLDTAGNFTWSYQIASSNEARGVGVAGDAAGSVLVTGWFDGELTLGDLPPQNNLGGRDIFVAKLSP
jgi:Beta-propeller repeat